MDTETIEKINLIVTRVLSEIKSRQQQPECHTEGICYNPTSGQPDRHVDIESTWFRIIDDRFKAHSYVEKVYKDKLVIKIDSSCYLSVFNLQKKQLTQKIREAGFVSIKKIEFKI